MRNAVVTRICYDPADPDFHLQGRRENDLEKLIKVKDKTYQHTSTYLSSLFSALDLGR